MPVVTCSCGERILVVPDFAKMDNAIQTHFMAHPECDEEWLTKKIIKAVADWVKSDLKEVENV
jgi:hypothetical protein